MLCQSVTTRACLSRGKATGWELALRHLISRERLTYQAGSDSGISATDNLTNATMPTFDVASTDTYFRFYDGLVQVSGDYETGATYTAPVQGAGAQSYNIFGVAAAGNVSALASPSLAVTIDRVW